MCLVVEYLLVFCRWKILLIDVMWFLMLISVLFLWILCVVVCIVEVDVWIRWFV